MTAAIAIYDKKIAKRLAITGRIKPNSPDLAYPSLGIVFPFQPTMWNDRVMNKALAGAKRLVYAMLKDEYSIEADKKIFVRIENIFKKLDFNTHRKSVAIILGPDEEKLIYLDFPVNTMVISGNEISLLDLISGLEKKEEYFLLVLENERKRLYDYNADKLRKVYEEKGNYNETGLFNKTYNVIELLNSKNENPVFVTGHPKLVELFCSNHAWSKTMFTKISEYNPFEKEMLKSFENEISSHWKHWNTKFITGKILIAQQAGFLITNIEAVTAALIKKADGLLIIDKWFSKRLKNNNSLNGNIKIKNSFLQEVENFLARGNRVLFTEERALKYPGSVALLAHRKES